MVTKSKGKFQKGTNKLDLNKRKIKRLNDQGASSTQPLKMRI